MRRRDLINAIASTAVLWRTCPALGQSPRKPIVGFLNGGSADTFKDRLAGFHRGLAEAGFHAGQNVEIDYRWADGQYERLPALVAELIARGVAVIAATGGDVVSLAAKRGASGVPVVFVIGGNPVEIGLVASLNRPDGNVTGISLVSAELGAKRMELIRELVPRATKMAVLVNPAGATSGVDRLNADTAARTIGVALAVLEASNDVELAQAFADMAVQKADALIVSADAFLNSRRQQLIVLARQHAVPTIFYDRAFAVDGGLLSYGASIVDAYRLNGLYVARILRGEQPADLPVQQPTKLELIINLRTAKALGLDIPAALLVQADEVIE